MEKSYRRCNIFSKKYVSLNQDKKTCNSLKLNESSKTKFHKTLKGSADVAKHSTFSNQGEEIQSALTPSTHITRDFYQPEA